MIKLTLSVNDSAWLSYILRVLNSKLVRKNSKIIHEENAIIHILLAEYRQFIVQIMSDSEKERELAYIFFILLSPKLISRSRSRIGDYWLTTAFLFYFLH